MAEAEGIPPTASVASVGPSIRYAGNWAYAYSGIIAVPDSLTTLINSTSGSGIIVARFQFFLHANTGNNFEYTVKLNNQIILEYGTAGGTTGSSEPDNPMHVIIPPFTQVTVQVINLDSSTPQDNTAIMTGRVYDV